MRLAIELTREAMRSGSTDLQKPAEPTDLGTALTQQFALIDRNVDSVVRTLNAHNTKLERALRRQRIWNYALTAGLVVAVALGLWTILR